MLIVLVHVAAAGRLQRYATDQTNSLTQTELANLERKLSDFANATSTQVVVLIVPTLEGESIEGASLKVAEENGIGRKGRNNGALLFIAKRDRQIRIEVGYGLEGVLTDAIAGLIIRREIVPRFRDGRFFEGINAGLDAIIAATKNEYSGDSSEDRSNLAGLIPFLFIILVFVIINSRSRRSRFMGAGVPPMFYYGGGSRGSSGWGGGGGFGGGGGSFGGGGASGSW